jgi:hypothetical protein
MGELGVYELSTRHLAASIAVRFTSVHYMAPATDAPLRLGANNVGVNLTMHINP